MYKDTGNYENTNYWLSQTTASVYDNYYVCNSHGWNVV